MSFSSLGSDGGHRSILNSYPARRALLRESWQTADDILARKTPTLVSVSGLTPELLLAAQTGLVEFDQSIPRVQQKRWQLHLPRDPDYKEPDDGVIRKNGRDKKLYLHYRRDLEERLKERGVSIAATQREWFRVCADIHERCSAYALTIARELDQRRSGFNFVDRLEQYADQHVLRILKYQPRPGMIAHDHVDRCGLTLQLAESAPGFYSYDGWNRHKHRTPDTPQALLFNGLQLERITNGAIPALYHGVENTQPDVVRTAVVFFIKMNPKRL